MDRTRGRTQAQAQCGNGRLQTARILPSGDLGPVARLRYEVYIREQGKEYSEADHRQSSFTDLLDQTGISLMAHRAGRCVGTVRINHFDDAQATQMYGPFLGIEPFVDTWGGENIATCTRLAICPSDRSGEACRRVFDDIYSYAQETRIRFCLIYCVKSLQGLFLRYGFRSYLPDTWHPITGQVARMLVVPEDLEHLSSSRSPFGKRVLDPEFGAQSAAWLNARLSQSSRQTHPSEEPAYA